VGSGDETSLGVPVRYTWARTLIRHFGLLARWLGSDSWTMALFSRGKAFIFLVLFLCCCQSGCLPLEGTRRADSANGDLCSMCLVCLCGVFACSSSLCVNVCSSVRVYAPYYIDVPGTAHARDGQRLSLIVVTERADA